MGDSRRNDLALLFSLAAIPMAGCPTGVEDGNASTFNPTVGGSNPTAADAGGDDDDSEDDGSEGGSNPGSASGGSGITTMTTAGDDSGGGESGASITNPSTDPTNASMTYGGTYGGTYGATYGSGGYGSGYGTGYGMVPPVCEQYVSNYIDCVPMAAPYAEEIANFCAGELMYAQMAGGACGSAIEEYFACMSTADCGEIGGDDPCYGSEIASVCGGG